MQVDIPTDGNSVRTPMVDGEPGQVNFSNNEYRFLFTFNRKFHLTFIEKYFSHF